MKNLLILLALVFAIAFSCKKESNNATIANGKFSLRFNSKSSDSTLYAVVTINKFNGEVILNNKLLIANRVGTAFVSDSVVLPQGSYQVTSLQIFNSSLNIVALSPYQTSKGGAAGLNLPFGFNVYPGLNIKFCPNITDTLKNYADTVFGYQSYTFPLSLLTFKMAAWDFASQSVVVYNKAKLVLTTDSFKYMRNLKDSINTIAIPNLNKTFNFTLTQAGHDTVKVSYPIDTLLKYNAAPLLIYMHPKS